MRHRLVFQSITVRGVEKDLVRPVVQFYSGVPAAGEGNVYAVQECAFSAKAGIFLGKIFRFFTKDDIVPLTGCFFFV